MFGYIRPCKPELKLREYEAFRSVYCGLCHQLGKSFGPFARFTLSYDFTFLAMVRYAQGGQAVKSGRGRCCANPLQKVPLCKSDEVLRFTADVAVLMLYYNLLDNVRDSRGLKRQSYKMLVPVLRRAMGQAARREPEAAEAVKEMMEAQRLVELDPGAGIDVSAEPTANALASIFRELAKNDPGQRRVLERFGYLVGRYIYLCDALDDMDDDRDKGGFNPLLTMIEKFPDGSQKREKVLEYAKDSLLLTIGEAAKACELLKLEAFGSVIRNVVYFGMPEQVERILSEKEKVNGSV